MGSHHLKDATPRFALVVWPDAKDVELPDCILLQGVEDAVLFGAALIAVEDADFCKPRDPVPVDDCVWRLMRRHPYRHDATWRPKADAEDGA